MTYAIFTLTSLYLINASHQPNKDSSCICFKAYSIDKTIQHKILKFFMMVEL